MKTAIIILGATAFLIANIYHDGKYTQMIMSWKKYYQMGMIGMVGLSLYFFIKKFPSQSQGLMSHANSIIKHMPIDRESAGTISSIIDFTQNRSHLFPQDPNMMNNPAVNPTPQQKRMLNSGGSSTKRCVSETKKKYVASQQDWKCAHCMSQLQAWFEVDHKIRLEHGGSNHISNLMALCRECHGKKTAMENM